MPPRCYICKYYDPKKMSLFRIPDRNDEYSDRGGLWLKLLEEKSENIHKIRICSDHFLKKKPAKSGDYLDIDWIPNKNLGQFAKNRKHIDYYYRMKKKKPPEEQLDQLKINDNTHGHPSGDNKTSNLIATNSNSSSNTVNTNATKNSNCNVASESITVIVANKNSNNSNVIGGSSTDLGGTKSSNNYKVISESLATCADRYSSLTTDQADVPISTDVGQQTDPLVNASNLLIPLKKKRLHIIEQIISFPKTVQTELTSSDIDMLFKYYQDTVEERNELLIKISTFVIDVDFFKGNDNKTRFYTGLTTWSLLKNFFEMIESFLPTHFNCKLSKFQMVVLTLMKLRLNLLFTDLGYRFQIDRTTASRYFHRSIYILYKLFKGSKLIHWPERSNLLLNTPSYFRSTFKDLLTVIVDCFEVFIERSSLLLAAAQAFSQYKHHATLKYLIGISTTGVIIFISPGFGGRASDKEVTIKSNFLEKLKEGDFVLADKGFLIKDEVEAKQASLKIPCFVRNGNQLNPHEIEQSRGYSSIRIHVERLISVVRQKFNICSDLVQMSVISKHNDLFNNDLYDKIVFICCCLVNICPSVVSSDFEI